MKKTGLTFLTSLIFLTTFGQEKSEQYFEQAVNEITEMLNGHKPLSFKRAVFLTENAYYDGTLNWEQFCNDIEQIRVVVNKMIVDKGLQKYKTAGNWAIFSYMILLLIIQSDSLTQTVEKFGLHMGIIKR